MILPSYYTGNRNTYEICVWKKDIISSEKLGIELKIKNEIIKYK